MGYGAGSGSGFGSRAGAGSGSGTRKDRKTWIRLTNFYGIEIKSFPAEIARLALLIAEFQSNVRYLGQREACRDVLPLHNTGHILCGNALRLDWLEVCPPPVAKGSSKVGGLGRIFNPQLKIMVQGSTFTLETRASEILKTKRTSYGAVIQQV
jgi:hypothetical protein